MDASAAGDVVVVSNGVYSGCVSVTKPLTLQSVNGPEATVIEGGSAVRCVILPSGANLIGFTLAHGVAENGGGVYCLATSAVLSNCVLTGNLANGYDGFGGGALGGTLNNCTLTGNYSAFDGGGVSSGADSFVVGCILNNCTLTGNTAAYFGGGAEFATLNNCMLTGNSAEEGGGTFYGTLNNCTLTGNSATWVGGACFSTLNNCIVYYNTASDGVANYDSSDYSTLNYCCTTPLATNGVGNITNAPLFVDYANGNLRLQPNSPCINAGNNAYVTTTTDLDGNPRVVGGTVDIGAYEYQAPLIQRPPQTQTAEAGAAASLWVDASSPLPLFYVWYLNDTNLISCSTNWLLELTNVQFSQSGAYSVVVSTMCSAQRPVSGHAQCDCGSGAEAGLGRQSDWRKRKSVERGLRQLPQAHAELDPARFGEPDQHVAILFRSCPAAAATAVLPGVADGNAKCASVPEPARHGSGDHVDGQHWRHCACGLHQPVWPDRRLVHPGHGDVDQHVAALLRHVQRRPASTPLANCAGALTEGFQL